LQPPEQHREYSAPSPPQPQPAREAAAAAPQTSAYRPFTPQTQLHARLIALGNSGQQGLNGFALYFVIPGASLGVFSFQIFGSAVQGLLVMAFPDVDAVAIIAMAMMPLTGLAAGGVGGYMLGRHLVLQRFERSRASTARLLLTTELPLLVADENFCRQLLETVKEQIRFMFTGPPVIARLEDQLSFAASYIQALQLTQFTVGDARAGVVKTGNSGYWATSQSARLLYLLGSLSSCLCSCLGWFAIPFLFIYMLRIAEQRGALSAICDYFAGMYEPQR
jgi:hypothetical protein